jgi:uncharacterized protein
MKLQPDRTDAPSIQACGDGWIAIDGERIEHSVVLPASGERTPWPVASPGELTADHFDALLRFDPEVVIFGSGRTLKFVHPSLLAGLMARRVGVETMDTLAACRTYNILAQEGRKVVAALVLERPARV